MPLENITRKGEGIQHGTHDLFGALQNLCKSVYLVAFPLSLQYESLEVRKRICATTCYLNPSEKDCFLAKMSEISGFDAIIFRIFK